MLRWREEIASKQASGHERLPLGQGGRAAGLVVRSVHEMAFEVDVIVDASANMSVIQVRWDETR